MPDWEKELRAPHCYICGDVARKMTDYGWVCTKHCDNTNKKEA